MMSSRSSLLVLLFVTVTATLKEGCCAFSSNTPNKNQPLRAGEDLRHDVIRSVLSKLDQLHEGSNPFFEKLDKLVEVKQSLIPGAGRGLFARQTIKAGSIVAFYPVHGLGFGEEESSWNCIGSNQDNHAFFNSCYDNNEGSDTTVQHSDMVADNYVQYLIGSRPILSHSVAELFQDEPLFINVNPSQPDQMGWNSHYINDGATVGVPGDDEQSILSYYQTSRRAKNCVFVPCGPCPIVATVTTCKVKKGQELFTTYGGSYWLDAIHPNMDLVVTDAIVHESREAARDIYMAMQASQVTYQNEAVMLQSYFAND